MSKARVQVIRCYYDALNERNFEALEQIVAPGFVVENSGSALDLSAFQNMQSHFTAAFPDLHHEIRQVVQEGPHLAVLTETTGTHLGPFLGHLPTTRPFRSKGIDLVQVDKGKVKRIQGFFDTLGMLIQLGLYTPAGFGHE